MQPDIDCESCINIRKHEAGDCIAIFIKSAHKNQMFLSIKSNLCLKHLSKKSIVTTPILIAEVLV